MPVSRHRLTTMHRVAVLVAMGILLSGCGIKSGLEPPRPAGLAETSPETAGAPVKQPQEQSRVESGRVFSLLPPEKPPEWEKEKQLAREKRNPSSKKAGSKSTTPDKPFILDSLL